MIIVDSIQGKFPTIQKYALVFARLRVKVSKWKTRMEFENTRIKNNWSNLLYKKYFLLFFRQQQPFALETG